VLIEVISWSFISNGSFLLFASSQVLLISCRVISISCISPFNCLLCSWIWKELGRINHKQKKNPAAKITNDIKMPIIHLPIFRIYKILNNEFRRKAEKKQAK